MDFDMLYYTTTNEKVKGDHRSEITGAKKPDIWIMKKNENGFVAWSIDKFSKVFQRAGLCFQVNSPQIETAGSSRHIG